MVKRIFYDIVKEASIKLSYAIPYNNEGERMNLADELDIRLTEIMQEFASLGLGEQHE